MHGLDALLDSQWSSADERSAKRSSVTEEGRRKSVQYYGNTWARTRAKVRAFAHRERERVCVCVCEDDLPLQVHCTPQNAACTNL